MIRAVLVSLVLFMAFSLSSQAQDCVPGPEPRNLLKASNIVFLGTDMAFRDGADQLRVDEAFKGVTNGAVFPIVSVGSMTYSGFQTGKQYLVFAYRFTIDASTTYNLARGCGLTEELKYAQAKLEKLRAEKYHRRIPSVYGMLLRTHPELLRGDDSYEQPLPGIVVKLQSAKGTYQTKTDASGAYAFSRVPPGTYRISADLPPDLVLGDRVSDRPLSPFTLPRHSSFDYELDALPTGRIRGHVVGPDRNALTATSVELYPADLFNLDRAGYFAIQDHGQPFDFFHLPPGDYILVFNRRNSASPDAPFPRTFYPGAASRESATVIHLSDGQQVSDADIHLQGAIPTRKITVRLHWNGQNPADFYPPQVLVTPTQGQGPFPFPLGPDTYSANLFLTVRYTVRAQAVCRLPGKGGINTQPVTIDGFDAAVSTIDLTFSGQCAKP